MTLFDTNTSGVLLGESNSNDKGFFVNLAALIAAFPVGQNGWYAVVGTNPPIFYLWDSVANAWTVDSSVVPFSGSGSPIGVLLPRFLGDFYLDTTGPTFYHAYGLTNLDRIS